MFDLKSEGPMADRPKTVEGREEAAFNRVHRLLYQVGFTIFGIYELLKFLKYLYQLW